MASAREMKSYTDPLPDYAPQLVRALILTAQQTDLSGDVIDMGCGNGRMTFPLLDIFTGRVAGVDSSLDGMIRVAEKARATLSKEKAARVSFHCQTFSAPLPFAPAAVTFWNSWHFVADVAVMIEQLKREAPASTVYIREPGKKSRFSFDNPDKLAQKVKEVEHNLDCLMACVGTAQLHVLYFARETDCGYTMIFRFDRVKSHASD